MAKNTNKKLRVEGKNRYRSVKRLDSVFDLLDLVNDESNRRVALYVGTVSLERFILYIDGFMNASFLKCREEIPHMLDEDRRYDFPFQFSIFGTWVRHKLNKKWENKNYVTEIIEYVGGDGQKAVDLFFDLYEEYKKLKISGSVLKVKNKLRSRKMTYGVSSKNTYNTYAFVFEPMYFAEVSDGSGIVLLKDEGRGGVRFSNFCTRDGSDSLDGIIEGSLREELITRQYCKSGEIKKEELIIEKMPVSKVRALLRKNKV